MRVPTYVTSATQNKSRKSSRDPFAENYVKESNKVVQKSEKYKKKKMIKMKIEEGIHNQKDKVDKNKKVFNPKKT